MITISPSAFTAQEEMILRVLQDYGAIFNLTGSRRFGRATIMSDFDFFIPENLKDDVFSYLRSSLPSMADEIQLISGEYDDSDCICVIAIHPNTPHRRGFHIQVSRDIEARIAINNILEQSLALQSVDKITAGRIWSAMFNAYRNGRASK